jgi:adenylate cyclase
MRFSLKSLFSINPTSLTFGTALIVVILFWFGVPILDLVELKTYDLRFLSRGRRPPSAAVVMAVIDEKSLDREGRWPWPRSKIAALVDALSQDGAKVVGFDIGFLEPDENSQLALIEQFGQKVAALAIKQPQLADFIRESRARADNDLALANAIKRSSAAVVLSYFFQLSETELGYPLEPSVIEERLKRLSSSKYPLVIYKDPTMRVRPFFEAYAPESNLEIFTKAAASSGYFSLKSDEDGVVRWMPLVIQGGEDLFPPLAILCAWHYLGKPQLAVKVGRYGAEGILVGDRLIPTDGSGQLLINYRGPAKTFPQFSASDVLGGKVPGGTFTDKIVLVGATAVGAHDLRSTPFSAAYPGVEIHANVVDNILTQEFMTRPEWSRIYDLFAIIIMAAVLWIALPRMTALKGLLFTAGLLVAHVFIARWLFVNAGVWLSIIYPLLALAMSYTALTAYHYATEERERRRIKGAFTHYVAPAVIDEMLKDPARLKLGGDERVVTVLFSDLKGFTTVSERYAPQQIIELLSEYYTRMTERIFDHDGMLAQYVGDELMAIFGAPVDRPDHAEKACAAALAMRDERERLRDEWAKLGRPPLGARTGINSGLMLVGNLGSEYRFTYSVLGDHVNLASRLEGLNKAYGTQILIGENTAQMVQGAFLLREIDTVQVVGREQAVRIYELVARTGTSLPRLQEESFRCYAAGLDAYRERRWSEALKLFEESLALLPGDGPSRTMANRCETYQLAPPPEEWAGVFEATQK